MAMCYWASRRGCCHVLFQKKLRHFIGNLHNRVSMWLQTGQRLEPLVIPNYGFTRSIFLSFPLELKQDLKQSASCQREIQENNRKTQGGDDLLLVRLQDKIFSPMAENAMIVYYSQAPCDMPELKYSLNTYVGTWRNYRRFEASFGVGKGSRLVLGEREQHCHFALTR